MKTKKMLLSLSDFMDLGGTVNKGDKVYTNPRYDMIIDDNQCGVRLGENSKTYTFVELVSDGVIVEEIA